jgi:glycerol-1-phosphate dehydrogenase [NAD(P)+]
VTQIETIYGDEILEGELNRLERYVVITDKIPWQLYQSRFSHKPVQIMMPETLEQSDLDEMVSTIPEGLEFVGLGGGSVIDAAKYFAYLRGKTPVLVPTITSSNAQFSDYISVRRQGRPFGMKKEGWPKRIIVDYELIRKADSRLNRAGYGDLLFMQTTLNDWRIAAGAGKADPVDPVLDEAITNMMRQAMESAAEIGSLSQRGIEMLMKLFEESTQLVMSNLSKPINAGAEHLFAWNLEGITGRHFSHGEIVSLGIVISSYLQKSHAAELKQALDKAQVIYYPERLGIDWNEIKETLLTVEEYNKKVRKFHTVFEEVEWTPRLFKEIQEWIYT